MKSEVKREFGFSATTNRPHVGISSHRTCICTTGLGLGVDFVLDPKHAAERLSLWVGIGWGLRFALLHSLKW
jgi:hypothetical protein